MSAENENKGNDNNKVNLAYDKNLKKLVAIIGGEKNLRPVTTVQKNSMEEIAKELFKEETDAMEIKIKEDLKNLLKKRIEMVKAFDEKKKELAKLEVDKKKEFNEAAIKLFNKISDLDGLEKDYYSALVDANEANEEGSETSSEETEA